MKDSLLPENANLRPHMRWRAVGIFGKAIIDAIFKTCRIRVFDPYGSGDLVRAKRCMVCFWHSRILGVAYCHQKWNGLIMVSKSEDGEVIAQVIHRQGHEPIRGSSRKGGAEAMDKMVAIMGREVRTAVIIPDGPQGPRFIVRPGAITLAQRTGYPIVPITYSARNAKVFRSWDRFMLPYPFTECALVYGHPVRVPPELSPEGFEAKRRELEAEMMRITRKADLRYGRKTD
ncbi:MAG: lysophospholipid acyltransferase family protein [Thermodesulfobacteriota bacterium]